MALVVFLRGVNVGGHRTFRPSILARELSGYDVLNVGAAGTFVVRKPGSRAKFRTALLRKLPFEAEIVLWSHEDNRLSWPDRQTLRRASSDSELEHNNCDHTNVEKSQGRAQGF